MLAAFRRHLDSWVAKALFALLVGVFIIWGVGDVIRNVGQDNSVATVAGVKIQLPEVQEAYRKDLAQVTRMLGGKAEPTPQIRQAVASQALDQVITRTAVAVAVDHLGLAVPDGVLRQTVFGMQQFRGQNGQFDRNVFEGVLRNNGLNEAGFLALLRADLANRQLFEPARSGAFSPDVLTREVFAFQGERRVADAVDLPFAAAPPPPTPTAEQLKRWYENHPAQYSTPEYRRIKVVVLSPDLVAKDVNVSEEEIAAAYDRRKAEFDKPGRRSIEVLVAKDEAEAKKLAAQWSAGADWATMQKENASAVELKDATREQIPSPELAAAAFAAPVGTVAPPVKSAFGWQVFKVTAATAGVQKTLAEVHDQLKARLAIEKAADLVYDRSSKVDDMLAGGTSLDDLPGDLGLAAVTGTLDAQGDTPDGHPAPIPGGDAMRQAIIQAAFTTRKDDPPHLIEGPRDAQGAQGFFALQIEDIKPPAPKPYDQVAATVTADWTQDQRRHEQETRAAAILAAVKGGKTLAEAAGDLTLHRLEPATRAEGAAGVPPQLIEPLFRLKQGEPTMVETLDGFTVAVLAETIEPDPAKDPAGYGKVRDQLDQSVAGDIQSILTLALRNRAAPKINKPVFDTIAQAAE